MAYATGKRAVEIVHEDLRPSAIMTREAFENVIRVNTAIGGSTNAPPHMAAIARHAGIDLPVKDWERIGYDLPLLANIQWHPRCDGRIAASWNARPVTAHHYRENDGRELGG